MEDGINLLLQAAISKIPENGKNDKSSTEEPFAVVILDHTNHHDDHLDAEGEVELDEAVLLPTSDTSNPPVYASSHSNNKEDHIVYTNSVLQHQIEPWLPANNNHSNSNNINHEGVSSSSNTMIDANEYMNMGSPLLDASSSNLCGVAMNAPIAPAAEMSGVVSGRGRIPDFDDLPIQMDALVSLCFLLQRSARLSIATPTASVAA